MRIDTWRKAAPSYTQPPPVSVSPYVTTTGGGRPSGHAGGVSPPSSTTRNRAGSTRRRVVTTSDTSTLRWLPRAKASTAVASKPASTVTGVPVRSARVTTPRPPAWASGRQASHASVAGSTASASEDPAAEAATAAWVRTTPLGSPVVPLVARTKASPGETGRPGKRSSSPPTGARRVGRRASRRVVTADGGRRWSTGRTASPRSHQRRSSSTHAGPGGPRTATSSGTAGNVPAREPLGGGGPAPD